MPGLTRKQLDEHLERPLLAKIATVGPDGWPHVAPVWFARDKGSILVIGRKHSRWVRNILADPKVSVVIDDPSPPQAKVNLSGKANILEGPVVKGRWVKIAGVMARKYFGKDIGPAYLGGTIDQPRYLIAIPMTRITTWIGSGKGDRNEWHHRYYDKGTKWQKEYLKEKGRRKR